MTIPFSHIDEKFEQNILVFRTMSTLTGFCYEFRKIKFEILLRFESMPTIIFLLQ